MALDRDVVEEFATEACHMVQVFMRHHEQVESFLPTASIGQDRLEVFDYGRQLIDLAEGATVQQDVKVVDRGPDFSRLRDSAVKAVADLDVVGSD